MSNFELLIILFISTSFLLALAVIVAEEAEETEKFNYHRNWEK